jgi:hypothetical protein
MNSKSERLRAQLDRPVRDYIKEREENYLPGQTSKRLESQDVQSTLLILLRRSDISSRVQGVNIIMISDGIY